MYYLCGADVILRIASEVKKRANVAKIGHFLGFCFVHILWLKDELKRCLQRVIWRIKRRIKTVANACFNVYGDESRTRIARSPFSTKNQIDRNVMQRSNNVATKASQNASSVTEPVTALKCGDPYGAKAPQDDRGTEPVAALCSEMLTRFRKTLSMTGKKEHHARNYGIYERNYRIEGNGGIA